MPNRGEKKRARQGKQIRQRLTELQDEVGGLFLTSKRGVPYLRLVSCKCHVAYFWTVQQYAVFHPISTQGEWIETQGRKHADTITGVIKLLKERGWTSKVDPT